ncbi:MAG: flagellar hook capping FlgD N-terminal domain-containing protein [Lachnospiraceae bacterium]|nr:flagellar hook capping FlgD N-terminal domain-containing protein [Lachnospiraceae bacterium]
MADNLDVTGAFQYTAQIKDGKVASSVSKVDKNTGKIQSDEVSDTAGGKLDKDAFLQLLVAQMKYQDPLEPTDNTEYVSQLANFSSLEQMTNMNDSLANMSMASDLQRASNLVGKFASVKVGDQTITGKVDTVEYKDGTAFLNIEGKSYALSSLVESIDPTYLTATELSKQFDSILGSLPMIEAVSESDSAKVENLRAAYDAMDMYQQSFISKDSLAKLTVYENRIAELKAAREAEEAAKEKSEETETTTEETDKVTEE